MLKQWVKAASTALTIIMVLCVSNATAAESMSLTLPDLNWALQINSPGFEIQSGGLRPDGLATKAMAQNNSTGIILSVFIEPAQNDGDNHACRDYYWSGLQKSPATEGNPVFSDKGNMALLKYDIKEFQGVKIDQKHVNAYIVKDNFWIDVHLSKVNYVASDKELFDNVLSSIAFIEDYVQSDMDNFIYASSFYMEENYAKAAVYYEKAVKTDRDSTQLPDDLWHVAVDNLGMAYGMSGDLENSKRALLKGIEQDPEYPMFYYNLACTYAEMNDKDNAMANLRTAYGKRDNMIAGEQFPDPRTDSSFQRYLSDPAFVTLIEELEG